MIDLGKLKITIDTGAEDAKKELNEVGEAAEKQESKFKKFGGALKKGAVVGATAVAAAGAGMYKFAMDTAETTDRIDKLSNKIGVSKTAFQEWDYVLGQNGMNIETMQVGMKTLVTQMDMAGQGTASAQEAFGALGVTWEDGTGKLKDQETMMQEAIYALADMENGTEKSRLATELFGKAGVEMLPMLNGGSEAIAELTDRSHELGLVMSDETVTAGVVLGDTMDDVKGAFGAVVTKLGAEFMPILQVVLEWVLAHMPEIQKVIKIAFDAIKVVVDLVGKAFEFLLPIFTALYDWISPYFPTIQKIFEKTFEGIGKAVKIVTGIFEGMVNAIKTAIEWLGSWNNKEVKEKRVNATADARYDGSHANGLDYVPFDNYKAILHKGEKVLTAKDNTDLGGKMSEVVNAVKSLESTLRQKDMSVNIGEEAIGKTAIKYANERNKITGEFAFEL